MIVPLFRLRNTSDNRYLFTISETERDSAIASYGFTSEGIAGYVLSDDSALCGPPGPEGPQGVPGPVGPIATQVETTLVPTHQELRDRFAVSVLSSLVAGHCHAGRYIGDPAAQMKADIQIAFQAADAMMLARQ